MADQKIKVITFYSTLLHKARVLGKAKQSGDPEAIAKAQKDHDDYAELCKDPNTTMQVDLQPGGLAYPRR